MIRQIVNVKVVLPDGILPDATVAFDDDKIIYIGKDRLDCAESSDGRGAYLFAGFVDIHCHGGAGYDFMDASAEEIEKIVNFHLSHGSTTIVPTTMTDSWEHIYSALDGIAGYYKTARDTVLHGAHIEGPWLSPKQCGAQSPEKMDLPSVDKFRTLIERYPFISRISVAPELENGMAVGRIAGKTGVVASVAHTDADFDTVIEAADNGYSLMTHLYSGMTGVTRKNAFRVAGAVEAGLYDDRLNVEIIADGRHLPTGLLKLIYKCKGADKICLITDAMRAAGLRDGEESILGRNDCGLPVIVEDEVAKTRDRQSFAGSVATTDRLVRVMLSAGVDPVSVSKMASATPARVMGLNDRGSVEVGKRADFVVMNEQTEVLRVIRCGKTVFGGE